MIRPALFTSFLLVTLASAHGQWTLQDAHTTADLRGIHSLGNGIAWASGTDGTVLHTTNGGKDWQRCVTPPGAEKLDFRGIQAFDAHTAIVMSSGEGDLSRLFKTTDACQTWKLIFTNPDPESSWDAIFRAHDDKVYVLGDPANGRFALFLTEDGGQTWLAAGEAGRDAHPNERAFAASNSSLTGYGPYLLFGTGGAASADVYSTGAKCFPQPGHPNGPATFNCTVVWANVEVPVTSGTPTSGIFSLGARATTAKGGTLSAVSSLRLAARPGDKPAEDSTGTAALVASGWRENLDMAPIPCRMATAPPSPTTLRPRPGLP